MDPDDLIPTSLQPVCFGLLNALERLSSGHPEGSVARAADALSLFPEPLWEACLEDVPEETAEEIQRVARRRAPEADVERFRAFLGALGLPWEEREQLRPAYGVPAPGSLEWLITLHLKGARDSLCFHADGRYAGRRSGGELVLPELQDPDDLAFSELEREVRLVLESAEEG